MLSGLPLRQTPPIALYSAILPSVTALAPSGPENRRFYAMARLSVLSPPLTGTAL